MGNDQMHPAVRAIASLSKRLVVLIPLSMLLGLLVGAVADLSVLKGLILPLTMLMVYPMLVNFRPAEALTLRNGRAVGLAMALNFIAWPLLAWMLARTFFPSEPGLFVGLLLVGIFPTSGMTISWTGFAKGNVAAAIQMTVIGLLAAAILAPLYLLGLAGTIVEVDAWAVASTVALVIFIPMIAGILTRHVLVRRFGQQEYKSRVAPIFPGLSTIGVMAIVFLAIGLKAPMILADPALLLRVAVPVLIFYAIALGIAITSFGPEAALVLAAAYIVQVQGAAWYVRLSEPAFASAEECTPVST